MVFTLIHDWIAEITTPIPDKWLLSPLGACFNEAWQPVGGKGAGSLKSTEM
ncbi:hypothetical protein [Peribacillus simplex]|uniref:hypothetical protein n=1 Tax=Peribacillus simplex TaxID=1478 RepID=UPI001595C875|nr:hypothetical protein [Peribacillus simplex]